MNDKKFRAVTKRNVFAGKTVRIARLNCRLFRQQLFVAFNLLAVQRELKAFVDGQQSLAAGVHHARFFEHGQQVRRVDERLFAALEDLVHQAVYVCALLLQRIHVLRNLAGHGENRAFLRLHHGLVCRFAALGQRGGEQLRVHEIRAFERAREPAKQLRENNAGVAARALERAHAQRVRNLRRVRILRQRADFVHRALHGHRHIRARIPVGNREYIQSVNGRFVLFEQCRSSDNHIAQLSAADLHVFIQFNLRMFGSQEPNCVKRECFRREHLRRVP